MSKKDDILVAMEDGIKTITINIPQKRNALSSSLALQMAQEVEKSAEDGTRVVLLTGTDGAFCSGAEVQSEEGELPIEAEQDEMISATFHRLIRAVTQLPRPVIAAVDGVAAGIGCSLALSADITLISARTRFILVFVNIALIPDGGCSFLLPRLVGMKKAMEMALTGDPVSAEEAMALNMVTKLYDTPEELETQAREYARRLAAGPVNVMGIAKQTFYEAQEGMSHAQVLDMESRRQARLITEPDYLNAIQAFLEKRKPTFS